jgi:hypothetical protein
MSAIVPGRTCGTCTLCCKVIAIIELGKPAGSWCRHCAPGTGCAIYAERPGECRTFNCAWLTWADLPDDWKPERSRIVLVFHADGNRMIANVDPQRPGAWRAEPYYGQLKAWARRAVPRGGQVLACIGQRTHFILPDRDVDLGIVGDDDRILVRETTTPRGIILEPLKISRDDPRASGVAPPAPSGPRGVG